MCRFETKYSLNIDANRDTPAKYHRVDRSIKEVEFHGFPPLKSYRFLKAVAVR